MHSNESTPPQDASRGGKHLLGGVMLAVLVWGGLLALGASRRQGTPWPALITLGCVLAFLEGWLLLLWRRSAQPPRRPSPTQSAPAADAAEDPPATP